MKSYKEVIITVAGIVIKHENLNTLENKSGFYYRQLLIELVSELFDEEEDKVSVDLSWEIKREKEILYA